MQRSRVGRESALSVFGDACTELSELDGCQNDVYKVRIQGKQYVLQLTPPGHRSKGELTAEIDFVSRLTEVAPGGS